MNTTSDTNGGWFKSNINYGRDLVEAGWEGARAGQSETLDGKSACDILSTSTRSSLIAAGIGLGIGVAGAALCSERRSTSRTTAFGVVGGLIGFAAGMIWGTRHLAGGMARNARRNIDAVRDARWLERNPIDYA